MAESWKKLLVTSLICHSAAFAVLLLVSTLSFTTKTVVAEFQLEWITARTWAEFLRLAPVFQGWATLLVYSWIVPMGSTPTSSTSFERFGRSIALLLVLTLIFAATFLVGHPAAASRVESLEFTSTVAARLRASGEQARRDQNYTRALGELNQYLVLVGRSEEVEALLMEIRAQARVDEVRIAATSEETRVRIHEGATASELLDRAIAAFRLSDYSTAHYMATLARSLDPLSGEAAQIAAQALQSLESLAPDDRETAESDTFRRKLDAKEALTREDFVRAYYQFAALADENARDVDVQRYLRIAEEQVASRAVFEDEVESALQLPGATNLVFVNRQNPNTVELVAIGKLVRTNSGIYGQRIELFEVDLTGRIVRHVSSNYGKLSDGYLVMNVIRRGSEEVPQRPTVRVGSSDPTTEGFMEISPGGEDLWLLASVSRSPESANIAALSRTIAALERYGLLGAPVELEFLMRLATPFSFLVFSLFLVGFGWRYRSRYLHLPPFPTLAIVPAIPFFLLPVYLGLQLAQRILLSAILLSVGLTASVVLMVVLQAVLLLLVLTYLAFGSRE